MKKDKLIAQIQIDKNQYSIRATFHALQRMDQRQVDEFVVAGNVLALGEQRLLELQRGNEEAIIIDNKTNTAIVIGFVRNTIKIITVINKANVFVKDDTRIEKI